MKKNYQSKKEINDTLISIIHNKNYANITKLIQLGSDINYENKGGFTTLMNSVKNNTDLETIKFLVKSGANCHIQNNFVSSILDYAKKHQDSNVYIFLKQQIEKKIQRKFLI